MLLETKRSQMVVNFIIVTLPPIRIKPNSIPTSQVTVATVYAGFATRVMVATQKLVLQQILEIPLRIPLAINLRQTLLTLLHHHLPPILVSLLPISMLSLPLCSMLLAIMTQSVTSPPMLSTNPLDNYSQSMLLK